MKVKVWPLDTPCVLIPANRNEYVVEGVSPLIAQLAIPDPFPCVVEHALVSMSSCGGCGGCGEIPY